MTDSVFVSIRLYDGIAPADQTEITRFSAEEFLPIIRADDGFIAYFVLPMEDRLAAINLFTSEELAAASNEKARDFVAENMAPLLPNPPQIVSGLVEVLYMAALADMETMAEEADSDETDAMDEMAETMMADGYGALSIIESGWWWPQADGPEASTKVYGSRGFGQLFPTGLQLPDRETETVQRVDSGFPALREPHCPQSMYDAQLAYFVDCIREDRSPEPGAETGLVNMRIVDAALASSQRGELVHLP